MHFVLIDLYRRARRAALTTRCGETFGQFRRAVGTSFAQLLEGQVLGTGQVSAMKNSAALNRRR